MIVDLIIAALTAAAVSGVVNWLLGRYYGTARGRRLEVAARRDAELADARRRRMNASRAQERLPWVTSPPPASDSGSYPQLLRDGRHAPQRGSWDQFPGTRSARMMPAGPPAARPAVAGPYYRPVTPPPDDDTITGMPPATGFPPPPPQPAAHLEPTGDASGALDTAAARAAVTPAGDPDTPIYNRIAERGEYPYPTHGDRRQPPGPMIP